MDKTADVRFSNSRIANQNDLLRIERSVPSPEVSPRARTLNKKSKELLRSPMALWWEASVRAQCHHPSLPTDCLCLFYSVPHIHRFVVSTIAGPPLIIRRGSSQYLCMLGSNSRSPFGQFKVQRLRFRGSAAGACVHGYWPCPFVELNKADLT